MVVTLSGDKKCVVYFMVDALTKSFFTFTRKMYLFSSRNKYKQTQNLYSPLIKYTVFIKETHK